VLLTDNGAKAIVTVFDEYTLRPPTTTTDKKDFRTALSIRKMRTPLDIYAADDNTLSELDADCALGFAGFTDLSDLAKPPEYG
jgi:hypothetical protein